MHQLADGNYRHKGVKITKREIPRSEPWAFVWTALGHSFDTQKQAREYIEKRLKEEG